MSMIPLERARQAVARGFTDKYGRYQVGLRMEEDLFEALHVLAQSKNIPFAAQVRLLLREGLKRSAA